MPFKITNSSSSPREVIRAGRSAFWKGKSLEDCVYKKDTEFAKVWKLAYLQAKREAEDGKES